MQLLRKRMTQHAACLLAAGGKAKWDSVLNAAQTEEEAARTVTAFWNTLVSEEDRLVREKNSKQLEKHWQTLERLAQRQVFFVWFNAWQYTGATDIWAGLVVVGY